ncbi:E3 ubiquitin-protein ligase MIB2 [Hordeum vulgare]|nr:E3 ubiquitin-protein ligase MIB2 [Hordeum vulgare]
MDFLATAGHSTNTFLLQVVKYQIVAFDIVNYVHEQGNTALHIAAFRGHLPVVEALMTTSPSLISARNEVGDTFLHMALTGFRTLGFRRLNREMELTKHLVSGSIMDVNDVINVQNDDGRTVLHLAVVGNLHSSLVELLMTMPSIDLNVRDSNGMTPLDLLKKQPHTASSEILIKELILAGGISNSRDHEKRSAIASQLKMHHIVGSPGTSFRISYVEIFLHAGIDASGVSERTRTRTTSFSRESDDDASSVDSVKRWSHVETTPTPLRQRYSKVSSLFGNKRTLASPSMKMRSAADHTLPESPPVSASWSSSSLIDKIEAVRLDKDEPSPSASAMIRHTPKKYGSLNSRLMNQYLGTGARLGDSTSGQRSRRSLLLVV